MSNYPRKIRITAYLTSGEVVQGNPITITDEFMEAEWGAALREPKNMKHLALTQTNVDGGKDNIFINPTYITHLRVTDVKE